MVNAHGVDGRTILKIVLLWLFSPFAAVLRDVRKWWVFVRANAAVRPGLFTYYIQPTGGTRRIHLRIDAGGSGILMVDGTDVVFLNPSAAMMVKYAFDEQPRYKIAAAVIGRFNGVDSEDVHEHVERMCGLVHHLKTTTDACPTCGLEASKAQPFSISASAPYKADLALTYGCNNACRHCYNHAKSDSLVRFDFFWQLYGHLNVCSACYILPVEPSRRNPKRGVIFSSSVLENHFRHCKHDTHSASSAGHDCAPVQVHLKSRMHFSQRSDIVQRPVVNPRLDVAQNITGLRRADIDNVDEMCSGIIMELNLIIDLCRGIWQNGHVHLQFWHRERIVLGFSRCRECQNRGQYKKGKEIFYCKLEITYC